MNTLSNDEIMEFGTCGECAEREKTIENLRLRVVRLENEEEALRCIWKASADIVQAIPCGLFILQYQPPGELFCLSRNPEAERLTGAGGEDCRGMEFDEMWHDARRQGLTDALLNAAGTGTAYETERVHYRNGRTERTFRVKAFPIAGNRLGVAFLEVDDELFSGQLVPETGDNHDQREAERTAAMVRRIRTLEAEVARLKETPYVELASVRRDAQKEMAAGMVRNFGSLFHRLQEACERGLTRLESGYASLAKASVAETLAGLEHASRLVMNLNRFCGGPSRAGVSKRKMVDLSRSVTEGVERAGLWKDDRGKVRGRMPAPVLSLTPGCFAEAEQDEMAEVVAHLYRNAVEAGDGRAIEIRTSVHEDFVVLKVRDQGPGILERNRSLVFEPFWTSKPHGSGMGLAVAEALIRCHGGTVAVESKVGEGTTITVSLPRSGQRPA